MALENAASVNRFQLNGVDQLQPLKLTKTRKISKKVKPMSVEELRQLMAMEQGRVGDFQGKNLEQIDIDPNEHAYAEESEENMEVSGVSGAAEDLETEPIRVAKGSGSVGEGETQGETQSEPDGHWEPKTGRQQRKRRPWTAEEQAAVEKHLKKNILIYKVPDKTACDRCLAAEPGLKERDWKAVKFYVKNKIAALKRKRSGGGRQ